MKNIDYENLQFLSELITTDMKILTTKEDLGYNVTKIDNVVQGRDIRFKTRNDNPLLNFNATPVYTNNEMTGVKTSFTNPVHYVEYNGKIHFFCEYYMVGYTDYCYHKIFDGEKLYNSEIKPPIIFNLVYGTGSGSSRRNTNHSAVVCVYNNKIHIIGKITDTDDSSVSPRNYHFYGDGESEWQVASSFPEALYGKYINGVVYNNKIHVFIGSENTSDLTMKHYSWNGSSWTSHNDLPFTFYNQYNSLNLHVFNDKIVFPVVCNTSNEICLYTLNTSNSYQKVFTYGSSNIAIATSNIEYVSTQVYNGKLYINNWSLNKEGFWDGTDFYLENRNVLNSPNTTFRNTNSSYIAIFSYVYKNQLYIMNNPGGGWLTFIYKCGHHIDATNIFYLEE